MENLALVVLAMSGFGLIGLCTHELHKIRLLLELEVSRERVLTPSSDFVG